MSSFLLYSCLVFPSLFHLHPISCVWSMPCMVCPAGGVQETEGEVGKRSFCGLAVWLTVHGLGRGAGDRGRDGEDGRPGRPGPPGPPQLPIMPSSPPMPADAPPGSLPPGPGPTLKAPSAEVLTAAEYAPMVEAAISAAFATGCPCARAAARAAAAHPPAQTRPGQTRSSSQLGMLAQCACVHKAAETLPPGQREKALVALGAAAKAAKPSP